MQQIRDHHSTALIRFSTFPKPATMPGPVIRTAGTAMDGKRTHIAATAYHEAGHAIAALRAGRQVYQVIVSEKYPGNGVMKYKKPGRNPFSLGEGEGNALAAWNHTLKTAHDDLTISLAGPLAESKLLGCKLRQLCNQSDLDKCIALAERVEEFSEYVNQYIDVPLVDGEELMDCYRGRTRRWVGHARVWPMIEAVAQELIRAGRLDMEQLFYVIGSSRGSKHRPILLPG